MYDPHRMIGLSKIELKKHGGHELRVFEEGIDSKSIAVGIECVTCRVPDPKWEGAYTPKILVKMKF